MLFNAPACKRALITTLVGAALALAFADGQAFSRRHPNLDLDRLSDAKLWQMIKNEVDDDDLIDCGLANPGAPVSQQVMVQILVCAFSDEGDDEDEEELDWEDLEYEMREAGTSLMQVIRYSVDEADRMTQQDTSPAESPEMVAMMREAVLAGLAPSESEGGLDQYAQGRNNDIRPARVARDRAAANIYRTSRRS